MLAEKLVFIISCILSILHRLKIPALLGNISTVVFPGVLNIIHGTHDSVNFICDNPDIKAISFVGSDQAVSRRTILEIV